MLWEKNGRIGLVLDALHLRALSFYEVWVVIGMPIEIYMTLNDFTTCRDGNTRT